MSWTENKTLLCYSDATPCKEIFQAVCDELGRYYEGKGFRYSRSRPKLTYKDSVLKVEICFWSSGSNTPGASVNLEIIPNFYSVQLSKEGKTKGFLFSHTALFYHRYTNDTNKVKVRQIFGDEVEWIDTYGYQSRITDNNNCNVYGIDELKFKKIIAFIDSKIIPWIKKLQTGQGVVELLHEASDFRKSALDSKHGNSEFVNYVRTMFPGVDIERLLSDRPTGDPT
jgi:hypothetical protein